MHEHLDSWTPPASLASGSRCRAQSDGTVIAGVPIGADLFVRDYARARIAEHLSCHLVLRVLPDVQVAYLVLRYCLGARFTHLLRSCGGVLRGRDGPPLHGLDSPVEMHDAMQRTTLAALLMRPEDTTARAAATSSHFPRALYRQASLPPKRGGVGLACADAVCESAFIAGMLACSSYLSMFRRLLHACASELVRGLPAADF